MINLYSIPMNRKDYIDKIAKYLVRFVEEVKSYYNKWVLENTFVIYWKVERKHLFTGSVNMDSEINNHAAVYRATFLTRGRR